MADQKQNPWLEALKGFARGLTTDLIGAPVDILNTVHSSLPWAKSVDKPMGGSEWLREKANQPKEDSGPAALGNLASSLIAPEKLPLVGATFIGAKAKNWSKDAESLANLMNNHGVAPEKIWSSTLEHLGKGTFFGALDKKARQEISDLPAALKQDLQNLRIPHKTTMGQVLDHPELYQAYPDLANTPMKFFSDTNPKSMKGYYNPSTGEIGVNTETIRNPKDLISTLLHETQHNIQNKEGFAKGGSTEGIKNSSIGSEAIQNLVQDMKDAPLSELTNAIKTKLKEMYHALGGEVEARNTQLRANLSKAGLTDIYNKPPTATQDVPNEMMIWPPN